MKKTLKLLGRLVAINPLDRPQTTTIILTDGADDFLFGVVGLVGPGEPPAFSATTTSKPVPLSVKPGDEVYYQSKARSRTLRYGGKDLVIIQDDDILGVLE